MSEFILPQKIYLCSGGSVRVWIEEKNKCLVAQQQNQKAECSNSM